MPALPLGSKAPNFELPDHDGASHSLSDALLKGPVLLTFFKIFVSHLPIRCSVY